MAAGNRHKTVFIGNLPFEGTEDELRGLFGQLGVVTTLRVVVDRDSGKRKGFAFLEYSDPDTAQRAVAQLDGLDFYGRTLRVSIAEQDTKHAGDGPTHAKKRRGAGAPGNDRVAAVIGGSTSMQLFEVLQQAKGLAAHQPHDLLAMLHHQPHLLRALHMALDRLTPSYHAPEPPMMPAFQPQQQQQYAPPPPPQQQYGAPPPPAAMQEKAQQLAQSGLLEQVMSLTPEMLAALPEHERVQMAALQEELRRSGAVH